MKTEWLLHTELFEIITTSEVPIKERSPLKRNSILSKI